MSWFRAQPEPAPEPVREYSFTDSDGRYQLAKVRNCDWCEREYYYVRSTSRFCTTACRVASHRADHGTAGWTTADQSKRARKWFMESRWAPPVKKPGE
jgi:hypothetical protein